MMASDRADLVKRVIEDAWLLDHGATNLAGMCVSYYDPEAGGLVEPFGYRNLELQLETTADTIFQLASVTKVFTSTMLGTPVANGQGVWLGDPVAKYLETQYGFTGSDDFKDVTLVQLATHTSGFPDGGPKSAGDSLFANGRPSDALIRFWENYKNPDKRQACWRYSSLGFVTLGFATTQMYAINTGRYSDILAANYTGPSPELGMPSTAATFKPGAPAASGYHGRNNTPATAAASDLKSTGNDMLTFIRAQLGIPAKDLAQQITVGITETQESQGATNVCPKTSGVAQLQVTMGLGWQISALEPGGPTLYFKNGATGLGGQSCAICFVPELAAGISVLTNQIFLPKKRPAGSGPTGVANSILSLLYPTTAPLFDGIVQEPPDDLDG